MGRVSLPAVVPFFWRISVGTFGSIIGGATIVAVPTAVMLTPPLTRWCGSKRNALVYAYCVCSGPPATVPYILVSLGVITRSGDDPRTLAFMFGLLCVGPPDRTRVESAPGAAEGPCSTSRSCSVVVIASLAVMSTLIVSMWADVVEDIALRTGLRLEGSIMAVSSFVRKAVSGVGNLLAGVCLRVVGFPTQATPAEVSEATVIHLVRVYVGVVLLTSAAAIATLSWYDIDRERHRANLDELERRRLHAYAVPHDDDLQQQDRRSSKAAAEAVARQRPSVNRMGGWWPHGAPQEKSPLI